MALHPRMTRPGLRITIEALEAYKPHLSGESRQIADDLLRELRYQLDTANSNNRRRAESSSNGSGPMAAAPQPADSGKDLQ